MFEKHKDAIMLKGFSVEGTQTKAEEAVESILSSSQKHNTTRSKGSLHPSASRTAKPVEFSRTTELSGVSNIHSLYQDLFITDMKQEIECAGNELIQLRQQLKVKENQNKALRKQNSDLK